MAASPRLNWARTRVRSPEGEIVVERAILGQLVKDGPVVLRLFDARGTMTRSIGVASGSVGGGMAELMTDAGDALLLERDGDCGCG